MYLIIYAELVDLASPSAAAAGVGRIAQFTASGPPFAVANRPVIAKLRSLSSESFHVCGIML
jgi:hypothetical protein